MRGLLLGTLLALIAAGYSGCGEDDEPASDAKPAATSSKTSTTAEASDKYAPPPLAELKQMTCGDLQLGAHAHTPTIYFVSGVANEAAADTNRAFDVVMDICDKAKESTKPFNRAVRKLR